MLLSGIVYYKNKNIKTSQLLFWASSTFSHSIVLCLRWRVPLTTVTLTITPLMKKFLQMKCRVGTWTFNWTPCAPCVFSNNVSSTNLSCHFSSPTCLSLLQGPSDHETNRISLCAKTKDSLTEICCCGGVGVTAEEETRKKEIVALLWCQGV